jgi:hypothetical protein
MFIITKGLEINVAKSNIDFYRVFISSGVIKNIFDKKILILKEGFINKTRNHDNYIYIDTRTREFLSTTYSLDEDINILYIGKVSVDANGIIISITYPDNTVVLIDPVIVDISKTLDSKVYIDRNLRVTNGVFVTLKSLNEILSIYVHNMGTIDNPNYLVSSVSNQNVILNTSELNNLTIDVEYNSFE